MCWRGASDFHPGLCARAVFLLNASSSSSSFQDLGVGTEEVVALALLLGSDYTEGVRGVGIVNAMEVRGRPGHSMSISRLFGLRVDRP